MAARVTQRLTHLLDTSDDYSRSTTECLLRTIADFRHTIKFSIFLSTLSAYSRETVIAKRSSPRYNFAKNGTLLWPGVFRPPKEPWFTSSLVPELAGLINETGNFTTLNAAAVFPPSSRFRRGEVLRGVRLPRFHNCFLLRVSFEL